MQDMINIKNKINYILVCLFVCIVLLSCNKKNKLCHQGEDKCIYVSMNTSIFVKKPTFKLYYQKTDESFAEFAFSNIGTIEINWNTNPVQVRSYFFMKSNINNKGIKCFKTNLDDIIDSSCCWTVYDMVWLSNGVYY